MAETHYIESTVTAPEDDILSGLLSFATESPYVLLTVEALTPEDGLTDAEAKQAGGMKVVARIGNGVTDKETLRMILTKALSAIPQ